ncbi:hypothetical protein Nepgr_022072 [Nepenthes gracilis]|uniref:VQ domain-containing protein n=1 Tax=Nepenthes gracilis TaxID=150966 RepID=A0AAD3T052_NEPGR|nr:hypothetical protein Nepgr_022072 [Nepenthes gracilis]
MKKPVSSPESFSSGISELLGYQFENPPDSFSFGMASSENLASIEPWLFLPTLPDAWISEAFLRDGETLTKALHKSTSDSADASAGNSISEIVTIVKPETPLSGVSGSDPETVSRRSTRKVVPGPSGKVTKRKSRASKRSPTTFITADPANFRQMVQQVTGAQFGDGYVPVAPVLKPEPQRPADSCVSQIQGSCLPTLDTSAFLLDTSAFLLDQASMTFVPPVVLADGGGAGLDFHSLCTEQWKLL